MFKVRFGSAPIKALFGGLVLGIALSCGGAHAAGPVLKFSSGGEPASNPVVPEMLQAWADEVNKAADGKFTIQVIPGPTLSNPKNFYERVSNGVADMAWGIQGATGLPFPKSQVSSLPFVVKSLPAASVALWRLYADGLTSDEYKGVKVLALVALSPNGLHSNTKFTKVEDLAGMKIRAGDRISADTATALGASPISLPAFEIYQGLNQGVVNALLGGWTVVDNFKLNEVVKKHLNASLGSIPGMVVMNPASYSRLPPDAKAILDKYAGEYFSRRFGEWFAKNSANAEAAAKALPNHEVYTLSPAETEKLRAKVAPVIGQWEQRTPGADKILAAFRNYQDEADKR